MSGLEVVGLITAIIAAYSGTATFLLTRKKRKEDKRRALENERVKEKEELEKVLALAPRQIQNEYDQDFARIGKRFAMGDSITRSQLSTILITMQCDMIQKLQQMLLSELPDQTVDYASLLGVSEVSRRDSITALAQHFQRFSVSAPIAIPLPDPSNFSQVPEQLHPSRRESQNRSLRDNNSSQRSSVFAFYLKSLQTLSERKKKTKHSNCPSLPTTSLAPTPSTPPQQKLPHKTPYSLYTFWAALDEVPGKDNMRFVPLGSCPYCQRKGLPTGMRRHKIIQNNLGKIEIWTKTPPVQLQWTVRLWCKKCFFGMTFFYEAMSWGEFALLKKLKMRPESECSCLIEPGGRLKCSKKCVRMTNLNYSIFL